MAEVFISRSPNGVVTTAEISPSGDDLLIHTYQDVEAVLDRNHAIQAAGRSAWAADPDMHFVGSIPVNIAEKWKNELGVNLYDPNHEDAVKRLLNSNEWSKLRAGGGRL
jgi:hypothetical protein